MVNGWKRRVAAVVVLAGVSGGTLAQDAPAGLFEVLDVDVHGFVDARAGRRTQNDDSQKDASLGEVRLRLDLSRQGEWVTFQVRVDLLHDDIPGETSLDLEEGSGAIDLREASALFSPLNAVDVKVGRQILTWGTGDLLFINDLFPKDWPSFFSGRDQEYLKAPSDAVLVSLFPAFANIDVACIPRFDSDRYITGERISYWNPALRARAGRETTMRADKPDEWGKDSELAVRLSKNVGGYELALYGYDGRWKTPQGFDPVTTNATFPGLSVYGASLRGALGPGVISAECGLYDSKDDRNGRDPFVPNGETRALVGYEQEVMKNTTASLQYYVERMQHYHDYEASLMPGAIAKDEDRHVLTGRIRRMALNQNLAISLFAYYSPSDKDAYLRPMASYKVTDNWLVSAGANIFSGEEDYTFFGQFEKNNNVYAATRYSF